MTRSDSSPAHPKAAVGAVIHQQALLMVKLPHWYGRNAGSWAMPGGTVEPDEDPEAAVVREIQEETSLRVKVTRHLHTLERQGLHKQMDWTVHFYLCEYIDGVIIHQAEEVDEARWMPLDQLHVIDHAYDDHSRLKQWDLI